MRVGIATDHGGFGLKQEFVAHLRAAGHEVIDFGAHSLTPLAIDVVKRSSCGNSNSR